MALVLITPPMEEPITLDEAKTDMRVDLEFTDHDAQIAAYITAARQYAETICRRALVTQSWRLTADGFPSPPCAGESYQRNPLTDHPSGWGFKIPLSPLASVDLIQYIDLAGNQQDLPAENYIVDTESEPPRVLSAYSKAWPATRQQINAVKLTITVGYGDKSKVPAGIKAAILMHCKAHYEASFSDPASSEYERRLRAVDALLIPYRVQTFA